MGCGEASGAPQGELSNPIAPVLPDEEPAISNAGLDSADPFLFTWNDRYWLTHTGSTRVILRSAETLGELASAPVEEVWRPGEGGSPPELNRNVWAPEFHRLTGPNGPRWYLYVTADPGDVDEHRLLVLESDADDPRGPYEYKATLETNGYAIDANVFSIDDRVYVLYAGRTGDGSLTQGVYIAELADPWTLGTTPLLIAAPEYDWERSQLPINEGPQALFRGPWLHVIYSADACLGPAYKLGRLTVRADADLLDPATWADAKADAPIFQRADDEGVYGPGHGSFFQSLDGQEDWHVYHATTSTALTCITGVPRTARVQRFTWNPDDTPNLGTPIGLETPLSAPSGDTTFTWQLESVSTRDMQGGALATTTDWRFVGNRASEFVAEGPGGSVTYEVSVPRGGDYRVLVRMEVGPGRGVVQLDVDGEPAPAGAVDGYRDTVGVIEADFGVLRLRARRTRFRFTVVGTSSPDGVHGFVGDQVRLR